MGEQRVSLVNDGEQMSKFVRSLLDDVRALEYMLDNNMFESDVTCIGAEQEMVLVHQSNMKPALLAMEALEKMKRWNWVETELAKFNLETNLTPRKFTGRALRQMEDENRSYLQKIQKKLDGLGAAIVLTGILPTLQKTDLSRENLTPKKRYAALIDAMTQRQLKKSFEIRLKGIDELHISHDSPLLEACNTSFQVHLQVSPDNFAHMYNIAQALAAPILAISANSPIVFGRRLWHENRIALFQQALDTRASHHHLREESPRVNFGSGWLKDSILEIYREDIARFRVLLAADVEEDSLQVLRDGKIPKLRALQVHNSTVYRWNRPCYGISKNGLPHLRIENRVIPSGPTVIDEMANAAFWLGAMIGVGDEYPDIREVISWEDASDNFIKAAQFGIDSNFNWHRERKINACRLVKKLLPLAEAGLQKQKIAQEDILRYLDIIKSRAGKHMNGARWQLRTFTELIKTVPKEEAAAIMTDTIVKNQYEGKPVHLWKIPDPDNSKVIPLAGLLAENLMTTDLFTVQKDDLIDLVVEMMDYKRLHHIPVEDSHGKVVGVVSKSDVFGYFMNKGKNIGEEPRLVKDIMTENPKTVELKTSIVKVMEKMQNENVSCLLVTVEGQLTGIITERDFVQLAFRYINRGN